METFFTPLSIITATIVGFCVGALWYSPFLFQKAWMKGEGLTKDQMPKHPRSYTLRVHAYSLIAHGAMATVLAIMFALLGIKALPTALSLGLLLTFGLIVTTRFIDMIYTTSGKHYEMKSQIKFLVSSGYYLTIVAVMSTVLFLVASR